MCRSKVNPEYSSSGASHLDLCVCVSMSMCAPIHVHPCVCTHVFTCGGQRSMSCVFLHHSVPYILRQRLADLGLALWAGQGPWDPVSLCPASAGATDMCCLAWLLHRFGDRNPGSHTCTANLLPTEPSPQSSVSWLECLIFSWYHHVGRFWKLWGVGTS